MKNLEDIQLTVGNHKSLKDGACVMELVSYLANEPWSDHPMCASKSISSLAIWINDQGNQEHRDKLKELAPKIVNTHNWRKEYLRAKIYSDLAVWSKNKAAECAADSAESAAEYAKYAAECAKSAAECAAIKKEIFDEAIKTLILVIAV